MSELTRGEAQELWSVMEPTTPQRRKRGGEMQSEPWGGNVPSPTVPGQWDDCRATSEYSREGK